MKVGRILLVSALAVLLAGCQITIGNVKNHDIEPRVFNKPGLSQDEMTQDSIACQDKAVAAAYTSENYSSTVGFTPDQIQIYENCMFSKGYEVVD